MSAIYLPLILWALHSLLGMEKGNLAYAELAKFLAPTLTIVG